MRVALFAAVSTPAQAKKEKVSLDDQIAAGRLLAKSRGWTETAGPFIIAGESRSRWLDLSTAARAVPTLEALIQSSRQHAFDVLICWDFTRFRDLLKQISALLEDSRIQLYSIAQPHEPEDPASYDPRESDTTEILQDAMSMASRLESKHKQRRWRKGVTGRVNSGLHFARIPFGYRKPPGHETDHLAVLQPEPAKARVVRELCEHFLAGRSLRQLVEFLDASGVHAPENDHWNPTTVRRILHNPFYAGYVYFGLHPTRRDRYTGRTIVLPPDPARLVHLRGRHEPLWDDVTEARIRNEFRRRARAFSGRHSYAFSQLLHCDKCGATLHCKRSAAGTGHHYWRCRTAILTAERGHAHISNDRITASLGAALQDALRHLDSLPMSTPSGPRADLKAELADLHARRQRWLDAFESGSLQPEAFAERIHELDERFAAVQSQLESDHQAAALQKHRHSALEILARAADELPAYLAEGDPQEVNASLREILAAVVVARDHSIRLEWNL